MTIMTDLRKSSIRVLDIASQYWCERQMEYNYRYGQRITREMKNGREMHAELESETNIPIILQPRSYPDVLYKLLYTSYIALKTLNDSGKTREVQLYGSFGGYKIVGKMDQLEKIGGATVISEEKTRSNGNVPSEAQMLVQKIQIMLYKKLMDDIKYGHYGFSNFKIAYKTDTLVLSDEFKRQLLAMNVPSGMQNITTISREYFDLLKLASNTSETLQIRYINQFTGKEIKLFKFQYKNDEMDEIIKYVLKYWNGERVALAVPERERWKCNWCVFYGKECKTWWTQTEVQKVL